MTRFRIGVDIGGTFTDIVLLAADGRLITRKISSTVADYASAIASGLRDVFVQHGLGPEAVAEILHGTTVAANAILERKGARTGLIASKGFRDILAIRNLRVPRLYAIGWQKPAPLVERRLRLVVDERVDVRGRIERPLAEAEAERVVDRLLAQGVEAIAVCLLNSFANPVHERLIAEAIRRRAPGLPLSVSSEVLPEIKEYERTSTTVVNAYVKPIVARYVRSLRTTLDDERIRAPLLLMQSNGGLTTAEEAIDRPVNIVESGPAGGVIGAQVLARRLGIADVITLDMGGTTAKAALIEGGEPTRSPEFQVGGGILTGSRLLTGAGHLIKVPAIDLAEVGAGGGSIVSIDAGGSPRVGPESAGAEPGPLCYDLGGTEPTVTDANLILGYINPERLVGGELILNPRRARELFGALIARPLGLSLEHAAHGVHRIAAANMMRAIRAVSTERGRDPRAYTLFAFGGNGPVFAASMARELGIRSVVVPPSPGLFSAFGLLHADVEHHYARTVQRLLAEADPAEIGAAWSELEQQAREQLSADGFDREQVRVRRAADLHYKGQTYELTVSAPDGPIDASALAELAARFGHEHERTYGHRASEDEPVELVNIRVVGTATPAEARVPERLGPARVDGPPPAARRRVYFGPELGWQWAPLCRRRDLVDGVDGPCIVEEYDATCVLPPGTSARLDDHDDILIRIAW